MHGLALSLAETPWEWKREGPGILPILADNRAQVVEAMATRRFLKLQSCLEFEALAGEPGAIVRKGVEVFRLLRDVVAREPRTDS